MKEKLLIRADIILVVSGSYCMILIMIWRIIMIVIIKKKYNKKVIIITTKFCLFCIIFLKIWRFLEQTELLGRTIRIRI